MIYEGIIAFLVLIIFLQGMILVDTWKLKTALAKLILVIIENAKSNAN